MKTKEQLTEIWSAEVVKSLFNSKKEAIEYNTLKKQLFEKELFKIDQIDKGRAFNPELYRISVNNPGFSEILKQYEENLYKDLKNQLKDRIQETITIIEIIEKLWTTTENFIWWARVFRRV